MKKISILLSVLFVVSQFCTTIHAKNTTRTRWLNNSQNNAIINNRASESVSLSNSPVLTLRSKSNQARNGIVPKPVSIKQIDIWHTLRSSSTFKIPNNRRINTERTEYLKHKNSLKNTITRAEPYIYTIIDELKRRKMPVELALLPLLESAYNPAAHSSARAAGLWQIMSTTADRYNKSSSKNSWFDPRKDFIESTKIALNILQSLNKQFNGDWLLTLAAYNAGDGRVRKAIRENQQKKLPTTFWSLNLPKETTQYVPRMLALIDVVKNNKKYNVTLPVFHSENQLVKININKQIKLKTVSELTGINLDKLLTYNAGYVRQVTQPNGPHYLMVPASYAKLVNTSLTKKRFITDELLESKHLFGQNYTAENRDSSPSNKQLHIEIIKTDNRNIIELATKNRLSPSQYTIYAVERGDSLHKIANKFKVSTESLLKWNKLTNPKILKIGTRLLIKK